MEERSPSKASHLLVLKTILRTILNLYKDSRDVRKISVKVRKLDTILEEHEPELRLVDVIAVDVEG